MSGLAFPPFPDGKPPAAAFIKFKENLLARALFVYTAHPAGHGIQGYIYTAAEWALLRDVPTDAAGINLPHVPIQRPVAPAIPAQNTAVYQMERQNYNTQLASFAEKERAVGLFSASVYASLDETTTNLITEGAATATLPRIMEVLNREYSIIPPDKVTDIAKLLEVPLDDAAGFDMLAATSSHESIHRRLAKNGDVTSEPAKIRAFLKAMRAGTGTTHNLCYTLYSKSCRDAQVPETWATFRDSMVASPGSVNEGLTADSRGHSADAVGAQAAYLDLIAALTAKVDLIAAAVGKVTVNDRGGGGTDRTAHRVTWDKPKYCYTHGYQKSHMGTQCNHFNGTEHDKAEKTQIRWIRQKFRPRNGRA
jgi:hypothetical protein